jgi:hypothetical protein
MAVFEPEHPAMQSGERGSLRVMTIATRIISVVVIIVSCAFSDIAQTSCGKPDSIAVSLTTSLYDDKMPLIVLSAKNISGRTMTCEEMENTGGWLFSKFHIEGAQGMPSKSIWFRRLSHEYSYPELGITLNAGCEASLGKARFEPGESALFKYPLTAYYFIDKPGKYSVYLDVHDPLDNCESNPKLLRTNTVQLEISPEQAAVWEAKAGTPRLHAAINTQQAVISLQQAPVIQIEMQNNGYTSYDGDDFFPHVERNSVEVAKTTYFCERLHEPGSRQYGLWEGPKPDFPETTRKSYSFEAHQSSVWQIDLRNFYKFDIPGKYSVYLEFPDFSGKLLRSNTMEFEIAAVK